MAALSPADREALRLFYEAVSRKDWDAVFCDVHSDFELKTPDRGLGGRTFRGREEASRALEDFFERFEEVVAEPQEFFERGDRIVVFFLLRSRPKDSTAVLEIRAADLWTLRDGRATRLEIFPVREEALEAAGAAAGRPTRPAAGAGHRRGDRVCGLAMIAAPLLILAAMIIHTPHGTDAASWLESAEADRTGFYLAHLLFLATAVALVPVALGLADLIVERERALARLGRGLALLGIAGLCVLVGMDLFLWQLVADPAMESRDTLRAVEGVTASVGINAPIAVLLAGLPLGFALLALGLYRTHAAKLWPALAIALSVPVTFGGLPLGWLAIVGAVVMTAGMGSVGWPLLRGSAGSVSFTLTRRSRRRSGEPVRGHAA